MKAARPDCQIILLTMNPCVFKNPEPGRERIHLPAYEQMYRDLTKAKGLLLVDNAPGWLVPRPSISPFSSPLPRFIQT